MFAQSGNELNQKYLLHIMNVFSELTLPLFMLRLRCILGDTLTNFADELIFCRRQPSDALVPVCLSFSKAPKMYFGLSNLVSLDLFT